MGKIELEFAVFIENAQAEICVDEFKELIRSFKFADLGFYATSYLSLPDTQKWL